VRAKTGSILFPTAIHTLWNLTLSGIWIWAIPDGRIPDAFALTFLAIRIAGLLMAMRLLLELIPRSATGYVCGPPDARGRFGPDTVDWHAAYALHVRRPAPPDLERYTERARRAVALAREEAASEGAARVGSEHLLLGLLHESDGSAAAAFREWHIELGDPTRLERLQAERDQVGPTLPFDFSAKSALHLAAMEADAWEQGRIGTDHLLVALTASNRTEAARILRHQQVSPRWLRTTTLRLMAQHDPPWPVAPGAPRDDAATA
jgi:Clp amino terminal domain, pathogenicity island component